MIASTKILEKYCEDYNNIENYTEAVKSPLRYDLHHRLEISENKSRKDLIDENLYYNRPAEELIFIEHGEHKRLHNANLSEDTRQKMSDAHKGRLVSEDTRQKISEAKKNISAETRKKISEANKGKQNTLGHHWNLSAETKNRMSEAHRGRHWHLENGKRIYTD